MGGPRAGVSVECLGGFLLHSRKKNVFPKDLVFLHCIMESRTELLIKIKPGNVVNV